MRKITILALATLGFISSIEAQTTIYENNFNSGSASGWSLNTSGSGENQWIVNSAYTGYTGLISDTPNQPATITGGPTSSYLHIYNTQVCGLLSVCNAAFDTGSASNRSAESPVINTSSYTGVSASFYYLCAGQSGTSYGVVEYSTNGGTSWTQSGGQLSGVSTWTLLTINDAALSNAANLKIRFRWQNGGAGLDPAFAVDEFLVTGTSVVVTNSISTSAVPTPLSWCAGTAQTKVISFNATGTYTAGNTFTAQLSDASGSFASPTSIGTLNSMASGAQTINASIPAGTPAGSGYLVRVISSTPATVGSTSASTIVINALPNVTFSALNWVCINAPAFALTGGSPASGTYTGMGVTANNFSASVAGVGTHNIVYSYSDMNGCSGTATQSITVNACASIDENDALKAISIYPNPTQKEFFVESTSFVKTVKVLNLSGKVVFEFRGDEAKNVSNLSSGMYHVRIETVEGVAIRKLLIP